MTDRKLGRGLDSLIPRMVQNQPDASKPDSQPIRSEVVHVDPQAIAVNRSQPRLHFEPEAIEELAQSISRNGILQPLVLRHAEDGSYELIAGERRLRAARLLKLDRVPAVVRKTAPTNLLELALIENIQREDLNPIELAIAYNSLISEHNWTQAKLAEQIGKKRSSVANTMRYLDLPDDIQEELASGRITAGHAKVLLGAEGTQQRELYGELTKNQLTVRALEDRLAALRNPQAQTAPPKPAKPSAEKDPHVLEQEELLSRALGTKVEIQQKRGRGRISIQFYSLDDYERVKKQILGNQ